jgi:hypothetical protein
MRRWKPVAVVLTLGGMMLAALPRVHSEDSPLAAAQLREREGVFRDTGPSGFIRGTTQHVAASYDDGGLILDLIGDNLLADPSFEAPPEHCLQMSDPYSQKPHPAQGWQHNGLAAAEGSVRKSPFARSGKGAWELVDTANASEPALLQFVRLKPEYRGKTFVFSVWARTRQGTNDLTMVGLKFRSRDFW